MIFEMEQMALHQAVRRLRDFNHNGWKRLNGVQLRLAALLDEFSLSRWEKVNARLQSLYDEVAFPLQQLREAGIDVGKHFPNLVRFEELCSLLLQRWRHATNGASRTMRADLNRLKVMEQLLTPHATKEENHEAGGTLTERSSKNSGSVC